MPINKKQELLNKRIVQYQQYAQYYAKSYPDQNRKLQLMQNAIRNAKKVCFNLSNNQDEQIAIIMEQDLPEITKALIYGMSENKQQD
jgi:hypothetical protein